MTKSTTDELLTLYDYVHDRLVGMLSRFFEGRDVPALEWPGTIAEASAELEKEWSRFRAHVAGLDDVGLARQLGPAAGPYANDSYHALVLRDLYRTSNAGTAWTRSLSN